MAIRSCYCGVLLFLLTGPWAPESRGQEPGSFRLNPETGKIEDGKRDGADECELKKNKILLYTAELFHARLNKVCAKYGLELFYNGNLRLQGKREGVQLKDFPTAGQAEWSVSRTDRVTVSFFVYASTVKPKDCVIEMEVGEQTLYVSVGFGDIKSLKDDIAPTAKIGIEGFLKQVKDVVLEK